MTNTRRWYVYVVSAISLQALTWAVISLLRNLLLSPLRPEPAALALQIAVIVVGGSVYLGHWLWARRLAAGSQEEREATLRSLYLYGTMASFLGPALPNLYDVLRTAVGISREGFGWPPTYLSRGEWAVYHLVATLVLGILWFYHWRQLRLEGDGVTEGGATVRRLYVLGSSAAGLTITTVAVIDLIGGVLIQQTIPGGAITNRMDLIANLCQLAVGVPLWLIFWLWAGRLFAGPGRAERASVLRKVYLYLAVFIGSMGAISAATGLLAGWLRRLIRWSPGYGGGGDYREALSIIIGMAVLWAYHAYVIRQDVSRAEEGPRQATVRRVYLYLVAGVGLLALAIGLAGDISVLVNRVASQAFGNDLRASFSWFTAAMIAGLPVWLVPWRRLQLEAREPSPNRVHALGANVRRTYLYLFLFLAAMTDLGALVFILHRLLSSLLGGDRFVAAELAQAIGYALIAAGLWIGHWMVLRADRRLLQATEVEELVTRRLAVVDVGDGSFGRVVTAMLADRVRGLEVDLIQVGRTEAESGLDEGDVVERLNAADLVLGSWTIAMAGGPVSEEVARAVAESPARKLLVPTRPEGWEWVGVDQWEGERLVRQVVHAVRQVASGKRVRPHRPLGAAAIAWIVVGALILLGMLGSILSGIFM